MIQADFTCYSTVANTWQILQIAHKQMSSSLFTKLGVSRNSVFSVNLQLKHEFRSLFLLDFSSFTHARYSAFEFRNALSSKKIGARNSVIWQFYPVSLIFEYRILQKTSPETNFAKLENHVTRKVKCTCALRFWKGLEIFSNFTIKTWTKFKQQISHFEIFSNFSIKTWTKFKQQMSVWNVL